MAKKNEVGFGMRIGTDLVAALMIGLGIGYLLDSYFETKPIFLIIFFFAGSAAGVLNVMRTAKEMFKKNDQDMES